MFTIDKSMRNNPIESNVELLQSADKEFKFNESMFQAIAVETN